MANVSHSTLSGADLHEPKGIGSAASNTVYVANGSGSGTWSSLSSTTGRVGEIFMWAGPIPPTGSLECDGSAVSRVTYADAFAAITISGTGSRTSGSPLITSLPTTNGMTVGMPLCGTGIPAAATILTVDSSTQITMSTNATSTGSATVVVAPHGVGDGATNGTFNLPLFTDTGRYPRSRIVSASTAIHVGARLSNQNKSHSHGGVTSIESATHTHTATVTDPGHTHGTGDAFNTESHTGFNVSGGATNLVNAVNNTAGSKFVAANTTGIAVTNGVQSANHTHTIDADGGSETRPDTTTVMFCIKV